MSDKIAYTPEFLMGQKLMKEKFNIWREIKDAFPFLFCKRIGGIVHTPYEMANRILKINGFRNIPGEIHNIDISIDFPKKPSRKNPDPIPWKEYAAYTGFGLFCFCASYLVIQAVALAIVKYKQWVFTF